MESIKGEVAKIIKDLSENTSNKVKIIFARFNYYVEKEYVEKMKIIDEDISGKIEIFGKNANKCMEIKESLMNDYDASFQKLYEKRKEQALSIISEIAELESNREVALANYVSAISSGDKDGNSKKRARALINKFNNYTAAMDQSFRELDRIRDVLSDDFSVIVSKLDSDVLDTKKTNNILSAISKFFSKFASKGKFERVISKQIENDIVDINSMEEEMMITIYNQTLDIVSQIELARKAINEEYMKVVG